MKLSQGACEYGYIRTGREGTTSAASLLNGRHHQGVCADVGFRRHSNLCPYARDHFLRFLFYTYGMRPQAALSKFSAIARRPYILYALLSLLILGPLLKPGFVLALDMVFGPSIRVPASTSSSYLFYTVLRWFDLLLPSDFLQKVMLFVIFFMAGWGMHRLVGCLQTGARKKQRLPLASLYVAGLFYTANPYTYERLMTGQYAVLLGYALLPWFTASVLTFVHKPTWKAMAATTVWLTLVSIVNIHSIVPACMVAGGALVWRLWQYYRTKKQVSAYGRLLGLGALGLLFWIAASSYWLVPLLSGQSATAQTIGSFTSGDRQTFATVGHNAIQQLGNTLGLQGFWAEQYNLFTPLQEYTPGWIWILLLMVVLAASGWAVMWRRGQKGAAVLFAAVAVTGAVFGAGIGSGWLAGHVPLFAGYREPQKFVALVALGYGVGIAYAVAGLTNALRGQVRLPLTIPLVWILVFALPPLTTSAIFWGARNQLRAVHYPAGWYAANDELNHDHSDFKTLFLPWHLYVYTDFAKRTVANPATTFFDKPVIVSDDPELGEAALARSDETKRTIANTLKTAPKSDVQLGQTLAKLHVKYILVAKISDYPLYGYLGRQTNLKLISSHGGVTVYRNLDFE